MAYLQWCEYRSKLADCSHFLVSEASDWFLGFAGIKTGQ
jgi:hypothetical protein